MFKVIKKRWYIILIVLAFAGFFLMRKSAVEKQQKKENIYAVKRKTIRETVSLSGEIAAEEKATLRFQSSGRLAWVGVKKGDFVKKYQTIASLDQRDIKNRLKKYLNTYVSQRLSFEQTRDDYWNKQFDLSETIRRSAQRSLEDSQYDLENSVLDVELQSLSLEYANLWTPIEGIITGLDVPQSGVNITPAGAQFEVVNPKSVYFSASVDQSEVVKLREGLTAEISLDAYDGEKISGSIYFIAFSPKQGETGTVYEVKIRLPGTNDSYRYKLGMTGDATFMVKERKNILAIPQSFVKSENGKSYVYTKQQEKKKKTFMKPGEEVDSYLEIKDGLQEGTVIYD